MFYFSFPVEKHAEYEANILNGRTKIARARGLNVSRIKL